MTICSLYGRSLYGRRTVRLFWPWTKIANDLKHESRDFRTIREIQPRAFKFYMEQRVDNLLKAANERFERKSQLEVEMQSHNMTEHERFNMRQLLRKKETNHLRLIRAKLSKGQFDIKKVLGKVIFV